MFSPSEVRCESQSRCWCFKSIAVLLLLQRKDQSRVIVLLLQSYCDAAHWNTNTLNSFHFVRTSPRTMYITRLLTGPPRFLQRHTIMSKRKVKDSHLPVGESITKVGASWILTVTITSVLADVTVFIHRYFQLQDILRGRFCRQQLPIWPQGVEAQYK